jgi:hypothetical protein
MKAGKMRAAVYGPGAQSVNERGAARETGTGAGWRPAPVARVTEIEVG